MAINAIQAAIRSMTGTERQFNGDLHAYWDQLGIPPGQFAERMAAWKQLPQNAAWIAATEDADAAEVVGGLWGNGEQGVWYDTSDLSTMFQDPAGTTPVYMPGQGQPDPWIGLQLDKRLGLVRGPERLTNGDFSAGGTPWAITNADATHVVTFSSGTMRFQCDTLTPALQVQQTGVMTVGKWYEITTVASAHVAGSIKTDSVMAGGSGLVLANGQGTYRMVGVAMSGALRLPAGLPTPTSPSTRSLSVSYPEITAGREQRRAGRCSLRDITWSQNQRLSATPHGSNSREVPGRRLLSLKTTQSAPEAISRPTVWSCLVGRGCQQMTTRS